MKIRDVLVEFAPGGGGDSGDYLRALASAWYNGTFDSGSLQKGIKSQQDVERLLNRGIVCPDGKTRKLHIDYNSDFDGVEIYSDDYYNHGDESGDVDSRTGRPFGPYDYMEFKDEELDESAKWRDPKYKGQLYTQEPPDYNDTREYDRARWDPKPKGYPGRKDPIAGGEFPRTDPLVKGFGRYGVGEPVSKGPRKGLPSRDQITSLKGSIKDAHGRHTRANLPEQDMAEGHADQQRRVFKKNGEQVGEVGIDSDGQWYMKYYPTGDDFGGYDSMEEAVADLKHLVNQFKAEGVAEGSLNEFVTPQAVAQDPGLEREKDVDVIFFGKMPRDYAAETAWAALEEVLPAEYPAGSEKAQEKVKEVAFQGGAVVTTKPLSVAKKLVATFNGYGIKSRINQGLGERYGANRPHLGSKRDQFKSLHKMRKQRGLSEFAADDGDSGEEDALHKYAKMWWAGDEATQMQIERALAKMGWEIGEDEGSYDNGGVFVVRAGDINGNSYQSWAAEDLTEGVWDNIKKSFTPDPNWQKRAGQAAAHVAQGAVAGAAHGHAVGHAMADTGVHEGDLNEKSTSQAQFRTMAAAAHNPEFAKKVGIKQSVAREFNQADKGQDYKSLPKKADESKQVPAEKEADYGDDYQDMVKRVKKLAGLGPLKTVYDPNRRVYRNMPRAEQPQK